LVLNSINRYSICTFFNLPFKESRIEDNIRETNIYKNELFNDFHIISLSNEIIDANSIKTTNKNEIEAIILRTGVQHVKKMAFSGMPKLKYIYISDTVETIGKSALSNCPQLELVRIDRNYGFGSPIQVASDILQNSPKAIITSDQEYADGFVPNGLPFVPEEKLENKKLSDDLVLLISECIKLSRTLITNEEKDRIFSADTKILKNSNDDYFIPKGYPVVNVSLIPINKLFSFPFSKIKSLTFPNGVKEITGSLKQLYNKGLKTVFLPSTLESVSPLLFEGCQQLSIRCPSDAPIRAKIRELGRNPKSVDKEHFNNYKESELY